MLAPECQDEVIFYKVRFVFFDISYHVLSDILETVTVQVGVKMFTRKIHMEGRKSKQIFTWRWGTSFWHLNLDESVLNLANDH